MSTLMEERVASLLLQKTQQGTLLSPGGWCRCCRPGAARRAARAAGLAGGAALPLPGAGGVGVWAEHRRVQAYAGGAGAGECGGRGGGQQARAGRFLGDCLLRGGGREERAGGRASPLEEAQEARMSPRGLVAALPRCRCWRRTRRCWRGRTPARASVATWAPCCPLSYPTCMTTSYTWPPAWRGCTTRWGGGAQTLGPGRAARLRGSLGPGVAGWWACLAPQAVVMGSLHPAPARRRCRCSGPRRPTWRS
jgi:hypothetical protein